MPYARRYTRRRTSSYSKRSTSRGRYGIPRLSKRAKIAVRQQNAGVDVKPCQFKIYPAELEDYTFAAGTIVCKSFNPLKIFNDSDQYETYVKNVWNEYRIVKATFHIIFNDSTVAATAVSCPSLAITGTTPGAAGVTNNLIWVHGWLRQSNYNSLPEFTTGQQVYQLPDSKARAINTTSPFEIYSSITADGSNEKNWICTQQLPGTFPNEEFFCPCWNTAIQSYAAASGVVNVQICLNLVVECRGMKLTNQYSSEAPAP